MVFNVRKPIDWDRPVAEAVYPIEFIYGSASEVMVGHPVIPPTDVVIDLYPLGLASVVRIHNISDGRMLMPAREIGSYYLYVVPGALPLYQGMIAGLYTARATLVKYLMSYYLIYDETRRKLTNELDPDKFPPGYMPDTEIFAPNSAGIFFNPYSSLFLMPFGLAIFYQTRADAPGQSNIPNVARGITVAQFYLERCYLMSWTPHIELMAEAPVSQSNVAFWVGFPHMIPVDEPPEFDERYLTGELT